MTTTQQKANGAELVASTPWPDLFPFNGRLGQLLESLSQPIARASEFAPGGDLEEREDAYELELDLPGGQQGQHRHRCFRPTDIRYRLAYRARADGRAAAHHAHNRLIRVRDRPADRSGRQERHGCAGGGRPQSPSAQSGRRQVDAYPDQQLRSCSPMPSTQHAVIWSAPTREPPAAQSSG